MTARVKMILFPTFLLGTVGLVRGLVLVCLSFRSSFGIGRGFSYRFGFRFSFGFRFGFGLRRRRGSRFKQRFVGFGLRRKRARFGIRLRRDCFRLWLGRFNFRFRFVWIHSVPLSIAVRMSIFHVENPIRIFVDARIMGDNQ